MIRNLLPACALVMAASSVFAAGAPPLQLQPLRAGYCFAFAPQGWRVIDVNPQGSTISLASADGSMRAAWGVVGVNSGQVAGYYGPQFRTPAAFATYLSGFVYQSQAQAGSERQMPFGFRLLPWRSANGFGGYTLYKVYPLPSDPGGYILSAYIGGAPLADNDQFASLAATIASTIHCTTQLIPPPRGNEPSDSAAVCKDFNSILGTGYAHDSAGNNYYVSNDNWIENGPNGPGWYKVNGNDVTKLTPCLE